MKLLVGLAQDERSMTWCPVYLELQRSAKGAMGEVGRPGARAKVNIHIHTSAPVLLSTCSMTYMRMAGTSSMSADGMRPIATCKTYTHNISDTDCGYGLGGVTSASSSGLIWS